jgi:branched-chain amino acid aminotransferase
MPVPDLPASGQFDGGCAFADGAFGPLSDAKVSLFDWGFTRSDATYDVASVWHGAFFRLDVHTDRFMASLDKLRLRIPYSRAELRAILHGCVRGGGLKDSYVAMVCTRGVPPRGARDPRLADNRFYAYAVPYVWIAPPDKQRQGIDLHISQRVRIAPESVDPLVKNYHWLDLVQSMFDAYDRGRDTSCVVDGQGHITEGPGFNVFMVKAGVVHTPDRGVLAGVSRQTALELCARLGLPVQVAPLPAQRLREADEVFLTSTGGGILPIARLDGVALPAFPGPVTQRLSEAYWAMHDEPAHRDPVDYGDAPPSTR